MINHPGRPEPAPGYLSYLLRLWHTHSGGTAVWRASLEHPVTREVVRFDSLPELFAYLGAQTGQGSAGDGQARDLLLTRAP
jgi:hypothetical protein